MYVYYSYIQKLIKTRIIELLYNYEIKYDPITHRLRCQGHILNLSAQAFLFVTEKESLEQDNMDKYTVTLEEMGRWRQYRALGKLYNFVVYIQRSIIQIQHFKKLSHGRALVRDNSTRWNSWYTIIKCATSPGVREAISRYFSCHKDNKCAPDELFAEDWVVLD